MPNNGPVRLPGPAPPAARPQRPPTKAPEPIPAPLLPAAPLPRVEGLERYSPAVLLRLLAPCLQPEPGGAAPPSASERLERCAALLTSRLVADGYVNSRVFPLPDPAPNGTLLVVQGRIVEVRVESSNAALRRRLQRLVLPLQGQVLHLPSLERQLDLLERLPGVSGVRASLNRLGGDSTKAVLVFPAPRSGSRFRIAGITGLVIGPLLAAGGGLGKRHHLEGRAVGRKHPHLHANAEPLQQRHGRLHGGQVRIAAHHHRH
jgi:hypothetical protein